MLFNRLNILILLFTVAASSYGQSSVAEDLILDDPEDMKLLMEEFPSETSMDAKPSSSATVNAELVDDLDILKEDLKDMEFDLPTDNEVTKEIDVIAPIKSKVKITTKDSDSIDKDLLDIGSEEAKLIEIASQMKGRIENSTWNEIASQNSQSSYTVVKGDWLWKISQRLFGSGFYYAKIWSLNQYITNPHEIEPKMVLVFTTGSEMELPKVSVQETARVAKGEKASEIDQSFSKWGANAKPKWIDERKRLLEDGAFVQYSSADTIDDLRQISDKSLVTEYESYDPPAADFNLSIPSDEYDQLGFDKSQRVVREFKEGFHLNTFISTNIVQDFGKVVAAISEKTMFTKYDSLYVKFDENMDINIGDKFSIYKSSGKVKNENSDREGFKYTVLGSVQVTQKHGQRWECKVIESSGIINRDDRITVYTPKIERITTTFNNRLVEAIIIGSYNDLQEYASYGDVIYIDRGRADGVEMGNVFEVYGFKDRGTGENITNNPTYKNGELTVISITDNFATVLVTLSKRDFKIGDIAITKTKKSALRDYKVKSRVGKNAKQLDLEALDELDVELNLDDLNDDILDKADQIKFTEDELAELERQEREKSIISESEKDLKALERLEKEISTAEAMLNEARLDEDKLLEGENLDKLEKKVDAQYDESLEELEENFGKLYLDEELNDKDNPYGLTEFDIEEIDELLNVEGELDKK